MALRSFVLILSLSVFASLAVVAAADGADAAGGDGGNRTEDKDVYDSKYDDIDLNELLKNDRLRRNYVKCLLDEGPCTPDGHELRNSLPDAIATDCSKCTEKQKEGSATVTHYLIDNQPEEWDELAKIYDKDGEYKRKYLETKIDELAPQGEE